MLLSKITSVNNNFISLFANAKNAQKNMKKKFILPEIVSDKERQEKVVKELLDLIYNDISFADRINKLTFPFTSIYSDRY